MFPEGQEVEIKVGAFTGNKGTVLSRAEAIRRNLATENSPPATENQVLVLMTFWGRELLVPLAPCLLREI